MYFQEVLPTPNLRPFINCFWFFTEIGTTIVEPERAIPDGCCEVIFHLGERVRRITENTTQLNPRCNFIGPMTRPYLIQSTGIMDMVGIRFFPHTAGLFFDVPLIESKNVVLSLDLFWQRAAAELIEQLAEQSSVVQRVLVLEQFLLKRIPVVLPRGFTLAQAAVQQIVQSGGQRSITLLCQSLGVTTRYLELIFRDLVGVTPKFFSRVIQFQQTFRLLPHATSLTDLAYLCNYTDQAHFIRTCRQLTGVTPKYFFTDTNPLHANFTDVTGISYLYNFMSK